MGRSGEKTNDRSPVDPQSVPDFIVVPSLKDVTPNQLTVAVVGFGLSALSVLATLASPLFLDDGLPSVWRWVIGMALVLGLLLIVGSVLLQIVSPRWKRLQAYPQLHSQLEESTRNLSGRLDNAAAAISGLMNYRQSIVVFELRSPTVVRGDLLFVLGDRFGYGNSLEQLPHSTGTTHLTAIDLIPGREFAVLELLGRRSARGQRLARVIHGDPVWRAYVQHVALTGQEYRTEIVAVMTIESLGREPNK